MTPDRAVAARAKSRSALGAMKSKRSSANSNCARYSHRFAEPCVLRRDRIASELLLSSYQGGVMRRRYLCGAFVGVLVIAAALSATAGRSATPSLRHGRMHRITNSTSTHWSGYAVTGGTVKSVSSSWPEPTATCSATAYSSFWVGLDGDTSNTVEQTGTDADCSGRTPQYYAWYEMYPKYPVNLPNTVKPGDQLTASVTTNGSGSFTLTI